MPIRSLQYAVLLLLCLCHSFSFGQLSKLRGTWVTPSQELMLIDDSTELNNSHHLSNERLYDENFELFLLGDTLSFQKRYYSSRTDYKIMYTDRYDLQIVKATDSVMTVRPVSSFSKDLFKNKKLLRFTRREFVLDTSIRWEKIVFHTTTCFGSCGEYHLEVDSSGAFRIHTLPADGFNSTKTDNARTGYFTGQLHDTLVTNLTKAVQTCYLRTLKMRSVFCCDGSLKTVIVYFNGQRRYFKSMFPPTMASQLINSLYDICGNWNGERTEEEFKLEE